VSGDSLDDFADLCAWAAIASGQASLSITQQRGRHGCAMRLDFDFHGGGGFVVARKLFALSLPESYTFSFDIRGHGPSNILEFKLVDAANENVWRWRKEVFDLPEDWQHIRIKSSEIEFAWGPLGGGPPRDIAAIELVIAAGPGGEGTVCFEDLRLEDTSYYLTPVVQASSALPDCAPLHVLDSSAATCWRSASTSEPQQLLIDFQRVREFGGLTICWDPQRLPRAFDILLSCDGSEWTTCFAASEGVGRESHAYLPGAAARFVRIELKKSMQCAGFGIVSVQVQPHAFSRSINDFFSAIAQRGSSGLYPKYLSRRQSYWTPVGTGEDVTQALFNEEGMVEVDRGSFSIEPLLFADGRLITWADVALTQTLEQGYLPIPCAQWQAGDLTLGTTAFATGPSGAATLFIRYRITNSSPTARPVRLFAAIRPFQVTPTWQNWDKFGGVSQLGELAYASGMVWVDRRKKIIPLTTPSQFGAATFAQGSITECLQTGEVPSQENVSDAFGYASGALRFDLNLPAHASEDIYLAIPFGTAGQDEWHRESSSVSGAEQFSIAVSQWEEKLGTFDIRLPPAAAGVVQTLRTAAAHVLINRAGPALHPGPRRYSRAWIRDGVLMGAALARVGLPGAQCDFIRWYSGFQAEDGKLPDCADVSGCEWLPEFDCWGQLIFAVMDYYRFSDDTEFLAEMWPAVLKSVDYMEALRQQRMTPEYQALQKSACYGLLPESMSHEGYMAHPVHAYWDDYWAIRGFKDAAAIAGILGEAAQCERITTLCADFQRTLSASLDVVIRQHGLDFVPGSVEFADFDPSATSIAITVAEELPRLPRSVVEQTYDKYLEGFRKRRSGAVPWVNYSAYEIRIIGALVRLGRREEAHELLAFFLSDRRILPWNQWPEISWHDPLSPSFIGDMPHSWIGAEYILAVRSLFAYEREEDQSLVIAAGIANHWLDDGGEIVVADLPTYYGPLSYRLCRPESDTLRLTLDGAPVTPSGGIIVLPPLPGPLVQVVINGHSVEDFAPDRVRCGECPAEIMLRC